MADTSALDRLVERITTSPLAPVRLVKHLQANASTSMQPFSSVPAPVILNYPATASTEPISSTTTIVSSTVDLARSPQRTSTPVSTLSTLLIHHTGCKRKRSITHFEGIALNSILDDSSSSVTFSTASSTPWPITPITPSFFPSQTCSQNSNSSVSLLPSSCTTETAYLEMNVTSGSKKILEDIVATHQIQHGMNTGLSNLSPSGPLPVKHKWRMTNDGQGRRRMIVTPQRAGLRGLSLLLGPMKLQIERASGGENDDANDEEEVEDDDDEDKVVIIM